MFIINYPGQTASPNEVVEIDIQEADAKKFNAFAYDFIQHYVNGGYFLNENYIEFTIYSALEGCDGIKYSMILIWTVLGWDWNPPESIWKKYNLEDFPTPDKGFVVSRLFEGVFDDLMGFKFDIADMMGLANMPQDFSVTNFFNGIFIEMSGMTEETFADVISFLNGKIESINIAGNGEYEYEYDEVYKTLSISVMYMEIGESSFSLANAPTEGVTVFITTKIYSTSLALMMDIANLSSLSATGIIEPGETEGELTWLGSNTGVFNVYIMEMEENSYMPSVKYQNNVTFTNGVSATSFNWNTMASLSVY